ncbi:hydrolase [Cellulophaga lytica]|uniref:hydrolase n=1 Tax=Cellulophaga lytica TaxID=979 RepID=UPI000950B533|nr:hydrolase [Cellulophaga lytica]APU11434.1 hydrolase [Cellulophaga lytica]
MKKYLYLYLFIFAALIALYQFVSANKIIDATNTKFAKLQTQIETLEDSIQKATIKELDLKYFLLENNDDALTNFDHLKLENPTRYIEDKLIETNEAKGDNPLVPYEGMEGDFKINKIKVLNHKWIIADFSDGKYWGELLIKYDLKDDLGVDFTMMDHLLYRRD